MKLVNVHAMLYELVWWVKVIHHVSLNPRPSCSHAQRRVWYTASNFLVVLSQHVCVNCVIQPDSHVITAPFLFRCACAEPVGIADHLHVT